MKDAIWRPSTNVRKPLSEQTALFPPSPQFFICRDTKIIRREKRQNQWIIGNKRNEDFYYEVQENFGQKEF